MATAAHGLHVGQWDLYQAALSDIGLLLPMYAYVSLKQSTVSCWTKQCLIAQLHTSKCIDMIWYDMIIVIMCVECTFARGPYVCWHISSLWVLNAGICIHYVIISACPFHHNLFLEHNDCCYCDMMPTDSVRHAQHLQTTPVVPLTDFDTFSLHSRLSVAKQT